MAENNDDFRKLIDERFNSVNANLSNHFESLSKTLQSIENQTLKTNGRVNKLENDIVELKLNESKHSYNCPQNTRFAALEQSIQDFKDAQNREMLEYNFMKKYPKTFIVGVAIIVIMLLLSYNVGLNSFKQPTDIVKTEQTK